MLGTSSPPAMMHGRRRIDDKGQTGPTLKRTPGGKTAPIDGSGNSKDEKSGNDEDERPTLKRREQ